MSEILRKHFPRSRSPFSFSKDRILEDEEITELFKAAFENCTLCGKCAMTCPMGINTGEIMFLARTMLCSIGRLPEGLINPVKTALEVGNFLGISTQEFKETIEWVQEEMEDEMGEGFSIPIDKKGAEILYIPHPLEVRDFVFLLMYPIKIMHAAGENYTFSSYDYDTVNYAYHQGNKDSIEKN
ncbi:MAG: 4Fe-4S dicluster domain-containing protein [Deltaproteobacteria bacterium]|nr:4Fe-4S dicluster domain-containing protein [Deltaproteobacteria bacterium]